MKTSKRMLAIVLALVMSFGFVLSASAADYTYADQDKVSAEFADAVALMKDLGIMYGSSTVDEPDVWTFRPQDTLNRSEVCKILFVLYTTGDNADNFKDMAGFTDVKAADWFAGYVNWAKSKGVVSGSNAAGTAFSPYGKVRLVEACKMFLVAMGYNATTENLVGSAWEGFTMSLALQSGLLEGLESISNSAELTREQLAQLCSNTLDANSVKYDEGVAYETSDSVLKKYFKFEELEGLVIATPIAYLSGQATDVSDSGKTTLLLSGDEYVTTGTGTSAKNEITVDIPTALGLEYLGRTVKVLTKATATKSGDKIKSYSISKIYSTSYADTAFTASVGDIDVIEDTADDYLYYKKDSKEYTSGAVAAANNDILFVGYNNVTASVSADSKLNTIATSLDPDDPVTIVYTSKGNEIVRVLVKDYSFAKVAINSAGKVSVSGAFSTKDKSDIVVGQNLAVKDSYVLGYAINDDKYGLDAPTVLTAKMSSIKGSGQDTFVISGKEYKVAALAGADATDGDVQGLRNKDATYYILGSKILKVVGDSGSTDSSDYCIITESAWSTSGSSGKGYADILTGDNVTYSNLIVKSSVPGDFTAGSGKYVKGNVFTFSLSSDKTTITLTALDAGSSNSQVTTSPNITGFTKNIDITLAPGVTLSVDDDSVIFICDDITDPTDIKYYAYSGAILPELQGVATYGTAKDGLYNATTKDILVLSLKAQPTTTTDDIKLRALLLSTELIPDFADGDKDMLRFELLIDDNGPEFFYTRVTSGKSGNSVDIDDLVDLSTSHAMLLINSHTTETFGGTTYKVITQYQPLSTTFLNGALTGSNVSGGYITRKTSASITFKPSNGTAAVLAFADGMEIYRVNSDNEAEMITIADVKAFDSTPLPTATEWNAVVALSDGKIIKLYIYESDSLWD